MKLQNLAVIFIIIILPISMILSAYTKNQVRTLSLQISYDTKLNNATYDALKAFQLNTINSDTSDLANSKLRDIEASVNTFFNSVASNFNMAGYNQDILKEYVPALVYTMYDGYYIFSPYTNVLDDTNGETSKNGEVIQPDSEILNKNNQNATYKQGDKISGLKPYIYYSCRYQYNGNDFVITYSLDNYITIQGEIKKKGKTEKEWVFDSGYLLDNITKDNSGYQYRDIKINGEEKTYENMYDPEDGGIKRLEYIKLNGVKYYQENNNWFSILNGKKYKQDQFNPKTTAAKKYYEDANNFKKRIIEEYELGDLNTSNAIDNTIKGEQHEIDKIMKEKFGEYKIFDFGGYQNNGKSIEDPNSNFNQHRLAVIRYSIEKNLSIAIANYNTYASNVTADFRMPTLQEHEWEKIINNVSIISFLQGLNIGGKIYNGYSVITNNKNQEVVNEDSIYILTKQDNQYHRANDRDLIDDNKYSQYEGAFNIDFERKSNTNSNGVTQYFIPKLNLPNPNEPAITGCYTSIVTQTNVEPTDNFYRYMEGKEKLATAYFTALGRERYGMYKTNNNPDQLKKDFGVTT